MGSDQDWSFSFGKPKKGFVDENNRKCVTLFDLKLKSSCRDGTLLDDDSTPCSVSKLIFDLCRGVFVRVYVGIMMSEDGLCPGENRERRSRMW